MPCLPPTPPCAPRWTPVPPPWAGRPCMPSWPGLTLPAPPGCHRAMASASSARWRSGRSAAGRSAVFTASRASPGSHCRCWRWSPACRRRQIGTARRRMGAGRRTRPMAAPAWPTLPAPPAPLAPQPPMAPLAAQFQLAGPGCTSASPSVLTRCWPMAWSPRCAHCATGPICIPGCRRCAAWATARPGPRWMLTTSRRCASKALPPPANWPNASSPGCAACTASAWPAIRAVPAPMGWLRWPG